jgi:hypothetical protein
VLQSLAKADAGGSLEHDPDAERLAPMAIGRAQPTDMIVERSSDIGDRFGAETDEHAGSVRSLVRLNNPLFRGNTTRTIVLVSCA